MVGSDDEVEVARQERWLQRIREQFEAEYAAREEIDEGAAGSGHWTAPDDTVQQPANWVDHADPSTDPPAPAAYDDLQRRRPSGWNPDAPREPYDERSYHHTGDPYQDHPQHHTGDPYQDRFDDPYGSRQAPPDVPSDQHWRDRARNGLGAHDDGRPSAPLHHPAADADGWLPPERAPLYAAPEVDAADDHDTTTDRWRTDTVTRSEIAPWSRPAAEDGDELPQQTETSGWQSTGDPWAPADEHLAEEYRSERSTGRRGRNWQHDSGDIWSTGRWEAQADADRDERPQQEVGDAGPGRHDPDDGTADPSATSDEAPPVRHGDAGDTDTPFSHLRDDDGPAEAAAGPHGWQRNGRDADDAQPAAINGHDGDPWTNVWDAHTAPDLGEVWTPTFDHSRPVNGNGRPPGDAGHEEPPAGPDHHQHGRGWSEADTDPSATPIDAGTPSAEDRPLEDPGQPADGGDELAPDPREQAPDDQHLDAPQAAAPASDRHPQDVSPADVPVDDAHAPAAETDASRPREIPPIHPDPGPDDADAPPAPHRPDPSEVAIHHEPDAAATTEQPAAPHTAETDRGPETPVTPPRAEPPAPPTTAPPVRRDTSVPPPLASLRNTRRPGDSRDAMEALQSLQDQLDRLGGTGRYSARRPRRGGHGTTDRSGR